MIIPSADLRVAVPEIMKGGDKWVARHPELFHRLKNCVCRECKGDHYCQAPRMEQIRKPVITKHTQSMMENVYQEYNLIR